MKVAITGGTGFVGGALADLLLAASHEVVLVSRRTGHAIDAGAVAQADLSAAFDGCEVVVHCAGINREIGAQTYQRVHIDGTAAVVGAARTAGVSQLVMLSFLRARPDGPTAYHRSKWAAEELVRTSGLAYTILKSGVIFGRGDHMLDHLGHALDTFPLFGLVGLNERMVRPVAVADVARLLESATLGDERLRNRTIAVLGPEELALGSAVRRVAGVVGRRPRFVRLPIAAHLALAHLFEAAMRVPLISVAQVHILAEGVTEPAPWADPPPIDLAPSTPFDAATIRAGLPTPGGFGCRDLRWCRA
jgi:uncharacterized protein YbjT (DUF2867 family)